MEFKDTRLTTSSVAAVVFKKTKQAAPVLLAVAREYWTGLLASRMIGAIDLDVYFPEEGEKNQHYPRENDSGFFFFS